MPHKLRRFARFKLEVPVLFSWRDENGSRRRARGYTRDLSPGGMYLVSPRCPPLGATVGLDAFLPPLSELAPPWRMHYHGRVVRSEPRPPGQGPGGFAAVSNEVVLKAVEPTAASVH